MKSTSTCKNLTALCFFLVTFSGWLGGPRDLWAAKDCDKVAFAPPRYLATGGAPLNVIVADFNGDSKQDFIVNNDSELVLYLGDGLGGFGSP